MNKFDTPDSASLSESSIVMDERCPFLQSLHANIGESATFALKVSELSQIFPNKRASSKANRIVNVA